MYYSDFIKNKFLIKAPHNKNKLYTNYRYDNDEKINISNNSYFTLAKYILSLIEHALSLRYILYKESQNLKEIITSNYLYDLFDKKINIIIYKFY